MTLTIKESPELSGPAIKSPRSNPVCLEVAVTIRNMPGENVDTPASTETFREEGRTVIVFDNGAVLRLSSSLSAGRNVILSNAQGRDVVCRVVSGRNLPTVKGYIEVEFMEQVGDYWRIHQSGEPVNISPPPAPPLATETEHTDASGSAPSFEDIAGLVRMSPLPAAPIKASAPISTISLSKPAHNVAPVSPAVPSPPDFSSPVQKQPSPNVFVGGGILAQSSSSREGRRRTPLIIGGVALLLTGLGGGYYFMQQESAPATAGLSSQMSVPMQSERNSGEAAATGSRSDVEQTPSEPASSATPAGAEAGVLASSDVQPDVQQNVQAEASTTAVKQPDPAAGRRKRIQGLKMKSPSATKQNLAKLSDASAPALADVSSTMTLGGSPGAAMVAPLMRSASQPTPPISGATFGKSVREPQLMSSTRPLYPTIARQSNTQGTVTVSADLDAKGNVTSVKVIRGPAALRQSATDAVKQWKYSPALIDGRPASSQVTVDVQFRLN